KKMDSMIREEFESLILLAAPRRFQNRINPLDEDDYELFRRRYRFSPSGFRHVLNLVADDLAPQTVRSASLTAAEKLGVFLDTIGSGGVQRNSGVMRGCSQPTVSRIIAEVSEVFYNRRHEFIFWPDERKLADTRTKFFDVCGIPNVVGAVDGSLIPIQGPSENSESFMCRKGFYSMNLSAIVDADQSFRWISVKFPGSVHDSRIFRESVIHGEFSRGEKTGILLADSGYRAENFLLKPILRENRTPAEERFTRAQCRGRAVVERAFGSLKKQFLSLHSELRYSPQQCGKIMVTACALRNIAIELREEEFSDDPNNPVEEDQSFEENMLEVFDSAAGASLQQRIVDTYFR
ncbi:transposase, IS4 family, partial [Oesophagostomum dentatum]